MKLATSLFFAKFACANLVEEFSAVNLLNYVVVIYLSLSCMVTEILQKYIFIFNFFYLKNRMYLYSIKKIFFFLKNFCRSKKIYLYSIKIYLCIKFFYIQTDFFS